MTAKPSPPPRRPVPSLSGKPDGTNTPMDPFDPAAKLPTQNPRYRPKAAKGKGK